MMNVTMVNVYAVVMDPPEKDGVYLSRFLEDVFEKKSIALASLRDVAREFAGELRRKCGGCSRAELEFERDTSKVVIYNEGCGQDTPKEFQLRIEKIAVPKSRIEFVDGKAKVKNWGEALNKDRRFIDWDAEKWAMSFNEAHRGGGEYSVEELRACCDWWKFIGVAEQELPMPKLVTGCPWFMDQPECAHIHVGVDEWKLLLAEYPEFADRCTVWDRFTGGHWSWLLSLRPEFAERCKWDKLNGDNWVVLLDTQPELSSYCQWNKLDGGNWCMLLKNHPEFADKCNWECLRGRDWCELLANVPVLEKHLVVARLKDGTSGGCGCLAGFLEKFPQHIPDCDLRELGDDWPRFLVTYPQYADQCDFSGFEADGWGVLLPSRPEFVDRVNWSIGWRKKYYGGYVLMDLLEKVPCVREKCDWRKLRVDVLIEVLAKYPEIADKCDLGVLTLTDWYNLLLKSPALGEKCPCWRGFSGFQIGKLLSVNISLLRRVAVNELTSEKTTDMLITAPELKGLVDLSKIDNDIDRMRLCAVYPELSNVIHESDKWRGVKGYIWKSLSGPVVVVPISGLIRKFPEYPKASRRRVGEYLVRGDSVKRQRGHSDNDSLNYEDAQKVVEYVFRKMECRVVAIDGVYVEESGVRGFADIMKKWLHVHETNIKLIYIEHGNLYNSLELMDSSDPY